MVQVKNYQLNLHHNQQYAKAVAQYEDRMLQHHTTQNRIIKRRRAEQQKARRLQQRNLLVPEELEPEDEQLTLEQIRDSVLATAVETRGGQAAVISAI